MDVKKQTEAACDILNRLLTTFSISSFKETLFALLLSGDDGKCIIETLLNDSNSINSSEERDFKKTKITMVELLVNKGKSEDFYDNYKRTVLHYAAKKGWLEIAQSLLEKGADYNAVDAFGETPLLFACRCADRNIVSLLIEYGADIYCINNTSCTLLHIAAFNGWVDFAQYLMTNGLDPNASTAYGNTPLHFAAMRSHKDVVALLVHSGVYINGCSVEEGCTALHYAAGWGCQDVAQFLLENGADPNALTVFGYTPLHFAVSESHKDMVVLLVDFGANVNICTAQEQWTALHDAACRGLLDIVQCLIENGADIDAKSAAGFDPFSYAVTGEHIQTIEYLVEASNMKYGRDDMPLSFIIRNCPRQKLICLYVERGAYFTFIDYCSLLKDPLLKKGILENVQICTQAVLNKYNNEDLPKLYSLPMAVDALPPMEQMIIASPGMIQEIERDVENEIAINGHCNVMKPRTTVLRIMSVKSYNDYFYGVRQQTE